jgi:hypothetical protein
MREDLATTHVLLLDGVALEHAVVEYSTWRISLTMA